MDDVAAGKHSWDAGHLVGIHHQPTPIIGGQVVETTLARARHGVEAQGQDDPIRRQLEFRVLLNQERARPFGVRQAEFGADEPQARGLAAIVAQHGHGGHLEDKPGAFLTGILVLAPAARHVALVAPIDAGGLARAVADGGAQAIHSGVAGAQDQYALAGNLDGRKFHGHRGDLLQDKGQRLDHAAQVGARQVQRPGLARVEAEEDSVELAPQLPEREVAVELDAQPEDDAALLQDINAALHDGLLYPERRGAIH